MNDLGVNGFHDDTHVVPNRNDSSFRCKSELSSWPVVEQGPDPTIWAAAVDVRICFYIQGHFVSSVYSSAYVSCRCSLSSRLEWKQLQIFWCSDGHHLQITDMHFQVMT